MLLTAAVALVALLVAGEDDEGLWAASRGLFDDLDAHPTDDALVAAELAILDDLDAHPTDDALAAAERGILDGARRWLPVSWRRCGAAPERDYVVWARLDVANLTRRALRLDAAAAPPPRLLTGVDFLVASAPAAARSPGLILKTSRCGSTVAGRMLAASGAVALMEPNLVMALLDHGSDAALGAARAAYAHFAAAAPPGAPVFLNLWLGSEAAAARALRAFPAARWAFLHREPLAVVRSTLRSRPTWLAVEEEHIARGQGSLRVDEADLAASPIDARARAVARAVGAAVRNAVAHAAGARAGLLVPYERVVPGLAGGFVATHFGLARGAASVARMLEAAAWDAKNATARFVAAERPAEPALEAAALAAAAPLGATAAACAGPGAKRAYCELLELQRRQDAARAGEL